MSLPSQHEHRGVSGSNWSQPTGLDHRHIEAAGGYKPMLLGCLDATDNIATGGAVLAYSEFGPWVERFRLREGTLY